MTKFLTPQFPASPPNRTVMIVLAYLWVLALIPLVIEKNDAEVQWHARNGILLMVAELILLFAYLVVMSVVSIAALGLGFVLVLLLIFAWVGILLVHVFAIIRGVGGGRLVVPGVSAYASRF